MASGVNVSVGCGGGGKAVQWRSWWWLAAFRSADHGGFWFGSEVNGGVGCGAVLGSRVRGRWHSSARRSSRLTAQRTVVRGSRLRKGERKIVAVSSGGTKVGHQGSGGG